MTGAQEMSHVDEGLCGKAGQPFRSNIKDLAICHFLDGNVIGCELSIRGLVRAKRKNFMMNVRRHNAQVVPHNRGVLNGRGKGRLVVENIGDGCREAR